MRFAGRAFLCRGRGEPHHRGRDVLRAGLSGPGWAWTDADHLELNGYAGEAIGSDGDLVLTLAGQNSVTESHAPDADITLCGMEVWGNLTLRGTGTLTATGSQCGIHVSQALVVDGRSVDARADGADITDEAVAGVIAGDMAVRGGGRVVAAGAGSGAGVRAYGVYLQDAGLGDGGVVDAVGDVALRMVIEPEVATPPTGKTDGSDVPGGGTGETADGADPAAGQPSAEPATDSAVKPAAATPKTSTTTKTTVTKTTATKKTMPKSATAMTPTLPKTGDSNWIAASLALFLLGSALLCAVHRC